MNFGRQLGFRLGAYDHTKPLVIDPVLDYSTYLDGTGVGIAVDAAGDATITGTTDSTDFPTKNPLQAAKVPGNDNYPGPNSDAFVATFNPSGSGLLFSTYLGGTAADFGFGVALDSSGNAYVAGQTSYYSSSSTFPTTAGAYQTTPGAGFVAKIDAPAAAQPTLTVTGFPTSLTAGTAGSFTVTARDAAGNVLAGYTGTVHFTSSDPQAVLPADYTFTTADPGQHTFSATLKTAGSESLTVTDTQVPPLGGSQTGITVTAAAMTHFAVAVPASVAAGTQFGIAVKAADAYGNAVTTYTGTLHYSSSDPRAVLPPNYTVTPADNGGESYFGVKLRTRDRQTIAVVDAMFGSLMGTATITVT